MQEQKRSRPNYPSDNNNNIKLSLTVSYGARKFNGEFYCCVSRGASSETVYRKTITTKLQKSKITFSDLIPIITDALANLSVPVIFNQNYHTLMVPNPNLIKLDSNKSAKLYRLLSSIDTRKWSMSSDGSLTVCIVDIVHLFIIQSIYFIN